MQQDLIPLAYSDFLQRNNITEPCQSEQIFDILRILSAYSGIFMRQEFDTCQAFTGCQEPDIFYCYNLEEYESSQQNDKQKLEKIPLFIFQEESRCYQRLLIPSRCRKFELIASQILLQQLSIQYQKNSSIAFVVVVVVLKFIFLQKIKHQKIILVQHLSITIYFNQYNSPCHIFPCNKDIFLFDAKGTLKFVISAQICQLSQWCHCYGNRCQLMEFDVYDTNEKIICTLTKTSAGCCQQLLAGTDNFKIKFPENCSNRDKALLLAGALLLDYVYFDLNYFYIY